jgi:hypothetical protein
METMGRRARGGGEIEGEQWRGRKEERERARTQSPNDSRTESEVALL